MKITAFSIALLVAGVSAQKHHHKKNHHENHRYQPEFYQNEEQESKSMTASILNNFKLWNCMTCKMAFGALDKVMDGDSFERLVFSGADALCKFSNLVPDDVMVCPDAINQYESTLFSAVTRYMLGSEHMCTEILGVCENPHIAQVNLEDVVNDLLADKPESIKDDNYVNNIYA